MDRQLINLENYIKKLSKLLKSNIDPKSKLKIMEDLEILIEIKEEYKKRYKIDC